MSHSRLLILLYVADRECLRETGRPIVGGRYVATDRGPLHSTMLDLVHGTDIELPTWATMFRRDHYDLEMVSDPGCGDLSKQEIEVLNRVALRYDDDDDYDLREQTRNFTEVAGNATVNGTSKPIPLEDVVKAVGRESDLDAILRDAKEKAVFDRSFSVENSSQKTFDHLGTRHTGVGQTFVAAVMMIGQAAMVESK